VEISARVAETFRPTAETFRPMAETFRPTAETFRPMAETFRLVAETFRPVAAIFRLATATFTSPNGTQALHLRDASRLRRRTPVCDSRAQTLCRSAARSP
jgi:hypothetical protein